MSFLQAARVALSRFGQTSPKPESLFLHKECGLNDTIIDRQSLEGPNSGSKRHCLKRRYRLTHDFYVVLSLYREIERKLPDRRDRRKYIFFAYTVQRTYCSTDIFFNGHICSIDILLNRHICSTVILFNGYINVIYRDRTFKFVYLRKKIKFGCNVYPVFRISFRPFNGNLDFSPSYLLS